MNAVGVHVSNSKSCPVTWEKLRDQRESAPEVGAKTCTAGGLRHCGILRKQLGGGCCLTSCGLGVTSSRLNRTCCVEPLQHGLDSVKFPAVQERCKKGSVAEALSTGVVAFGQAMGHGLTLTDADMRSRASITTLYRNN